MSQAIVSLSCSFRACLALLMAIQTSATSYTPSLVPPMMNWYQMLSAAVIIPGSIAHLRGIKTHRTNDKRLTSILEHGAITPIAASLAPTSSALSLVPSDVPTKSSSVPSSVPSSGPTSSPLFTSLAPTSPPLSLVPSNVPTNSSSVPSSVPSTEPTSSPLFTNNHISWEEYQVQGVPPHARGDQWQTTWNGDLLIVGGRREIGTSKRINYEFPESVHVLKNLTTWERLDKGESLPGRYAAAEGVFEDKLFIYGGLGKTFGSNPRLFVFSDTWVFDLKQGTWRMVINNSPPGKRLWATGAVYDDRMYVYGGSETYPDYNEPTASGVWYLDMVKEIWRQVPVNQAPWERPEVPELQTGGTTAVTAKLGGTPYLVQIGSNSNFIRIYGDIRLLPINEENTSWESLYCTGGENFITGLEDAAGYRAVVLDESETVSILIVGRRTDRCSAQSQWILTITPEKSCQLVSTIDFTKFMPPSYGGVNMARTDGGVVVYGGRETCASDGSVNGYSTNAWLLTYNTNCISSCLSLNVDVQSGTYTFVYKNGVPNSVVLLGGTYIYRPGEATFRGEPGILRKTMTATNNAGEATWIIPLRSPPPFTIWVQAFQQNGVSNIVALDSNIPIPFLEPSVSPRDIPSSIPSDDPSHFTSVVPSLVLSVNPFMVPSNVPSISFEPTSESSEHPSEIPSKVPSFSPSKVSSGEPTNMQLSVPSGIPIKTPSSEPSTDTPSSQPTGISAPTSTPTSVPTKAQTSAPTSAPTSTPNSAPTMAPTSSSTSVPT